MVAVAVGFAGAIVVVRRVRPASLAAQTAVGTMTSGIERALSGVRTIRAAGAEEREEAAVTVFARDAFAAGLQLARLRALLGPLAAVAVQGAFLAVLGVGGARVASGTITVRDLVAFVLLLFLLVQPLAQGIQALTAVQTGLGALSRIQEVLDLPPRAPPTSSPPTCRSARRLRCASGTSALPMPQGEASFMARRSSRRPADVRRWSGRPGPGSRRCSR